MNNKCEKNWIGVWSLVARVVGLLLTVLFGVLGEVRAHGSSQDAENHHQVTVEVVGACGEAVQRQEEPRQKIGEPLWELSAICCHSADRVPLRADEISSVRSNSETSSQ